jgi:hypothetical protein
MPSQIAAIASGDTGAPFARVAGAAGTGEIITSADYAGTAAGRSPHRCADF